MCVFNVCVFIVFETERGHESEVEFKRGGGIGSIIEYIQ